MQLFIVVLTEGDYVPQIMKNLYQNDYHGSVLSTKSIHHAFMDSVEPEPYFGGFSKMVDTMTEGNRPMIFVVVKQDDEINVKDDLNYEDDEIKKLSKIVNDSVNGIKGKGFMYSVPVSFLEGLDD